jgi:hypothetical protein
MALLRASLGRPCIVASTVRTSLDPEVDAVVEHLDQIDLVWHVSESVQVEPTERSSVGGHFYVVHDLTRARSLSALVVVKALNTEF